MTKKPKRTHQSTGELGSLFGDMLQEDTATVQSGPVTVLGLTFADDDKRRAYFRYLKLF